MIKLRPGGRWRHMPGLLRFGAAGRVFSIAPGPTMRREMDAVICGHFYTLCVQRGVEIWKSAVRGLSLHQFGRGNRCLEHLLHDCSTLLRGRMRHYLYFKRHRSLEIWKSEVRRLIFASLSTSAEVVKRDQHRTWLKISA